MVEDDVEQESVNHIVTRNKVLIRSSNTCEILKRIWTSGDQCAEGKT